MNTATVVPFRAEAIVVVPHPQVFTALMVDRLRAVNRQVRWLRMHKHAVLSIDLLSFRPTLLVDAAAADLLVSAGRGKSTFRRMGEAPLHTVVIDGCKLQWRDSGGVWPTC